MTMTTYTNQREAAMPTAAVVGLAMGDPQLGIGWAGGIANREWGTSRTPGFTAKHSARHLGRSST